MFRNLSDKPIAEVQNAQADAWEEQDLLGESIALREGAPSFVFYEGPPTANGMPGIHHVVARTLKDSVCRYKTMRGYQVYRKAGWDTHGLPVEIEVEKQLGMSGKQDIEAYGIREFNQRCRESVFVYEKAWREMTKRMGYLIDMDNPYITLENDYIESVWWLLKQFFDGGLIYEGHKILPYCPRCGTGLASHEVAQGYKEVKSNTITCRFKKVGEENTYFLAWTTTPWTLASNVSLTVGPDVDYIKAEQNGEYLYVARDLADKVLEPGGDYAVVETVKGRDLEYVEYEQLMPFVEVDKKAFFITVGDYVSTEEGTGIVHTAPAFGEDDYLTGRKYDLPVPNPVDLEGRYTTTPWAGRFVMEEGLDVDIIRHLAGENKIYSKERIEHNYPHCWRCSTQLVYYGTPSWYIEMTKLRDELVASNDATNWFPPFIGEGRFGNWIADVKDWAISRSRYWGTPINIWRCSCGHLESVGSRAELVEMAIEDIDETIELHRPDVDEVHLRCPKCAGSMERIPEVLDCWFDSGAMPFAQHHYPFENEDIFDEKLFPADFICEGIDQTRGWFYSLMAISTFIKGRSSYRNVLVNDLVLDKEGKKMSKSRGNTVDPFELFDRFGADATRWYLLYVSPVWLPTRFDEEGLIDVQGKFFGTLRNVYNFFTLYANNDHIDPSTFSVEAEEQPELDRWILSKYHRLVRNVIQAMDAYDHNRSVRHIQDFVAEDLSNWYIRRARRRFYADGLTEDKKSVYATTFYVLQGVARLIAPFAPFIADELYINLTGADSVHLVDYPEACEERIDDGLEERMDLVRNIVTMARGIREKSRIKVRQPLQELLIDGEHEAQISYMTDLIMEELNVKEVVFEQDMEEFINYGLKPDFRVAGPLLGPRIKAFARALSDADAKSFIRELQEQKEVRLELDGEQVSITEDMVDVAIFAKEGFTVSLENNLCVILDTEVTPALEAEGLAREFISKVQQLRKQKDFEMMDRIRIFAEAPDAVKEAVNSYDDFIRKETLADAIEWREGLPSFDLNGHDTGIDVERIS